MGLFRGSISAKEVFSKVASGVDKAIFTQEEKAENNIENANLLTQFYKMTLGESTVRSKTRRAVALLVICTQLLIILAWVILPIFKIDTSHFAEVQDKTNLSVAFLMIIAFFFGGYYYNKYTEKRRR